MSIVRNRNLRKAGVKNIKSDKRKARKYVHSFLRCNMGYAYNNIACYLGYNNDFWKFSKALIW